MLFTGFGPVRSVSGTGGVIGFFEDGTAYLVNRDYQRSASFTVEADTPISRWENGDFLTHLNFDAFCEYVLPYKCVEGQTFDDWKDAAVLADLKETQKKLQDKGKEKAKAPAARRKKGEQAL